MSEEIKEEEVLGTEETVGTKEDVETGTVNKTVEDNGGENNTTDEAEDVPTDEEISAEKQEELEYIDFIQCEVDKVAFGEYPVKPLVPSILHTDKAEDLIPYLRLAQSKLMESSAKTVVDIYEKGIENFKIEDHYTNIANNIRNGYIFILINNVLSHIVVNEGSFSTDCVDQVIENCETSIPEWVHNEGPLNVHHFCKSLGIPKGTVDDKLLIEILYGNNGHLTSADISATPLVILHCVIALYGRKHWSKIYNEMIRINNSEKV